MPHVGALLEALASSSTRPLDLQGTGFDPLDLALDGGFNSEELVLVGGRPGVGKTVMMTPAGPDRGADRTSGRVRQLRAQRTGDALAAADPRAGRDRGRPGRDDVAHPPSSGPLVLFRIDHRRGVPGLPPPTVRVGRSPGVTR